jgi:hypothetical protein
VKIPAWLLTFLLAGGLIALMLYFAGDAISNFLRDVPAGNAYNAAPFCTPPDTTTATGAPCRTWIDATITGHWSEYHAARYGGDHYYLDLRLADGAIYYGVELSDAGLPWGGLWNAVQKGDTVQAELWQDAIVHVRAGDRTEPTSDDPASRGTGSLLGCLCLAPYSLMVVLIILVGLTVDKWPLSKGRPPPPQSPEPPST